MSWLGSIVGIGGAATGAYLAAPSLKEWASGLFRRTTDKHPNEEIATQARALATELESEMEDTAVVGRIKEDPKVSLAETQVQVIMTPPQNIEVAYAGDGKRSSGHKLIYQNIATQGAVTFLLPPDTQWKDVEIVDTGKRLTLKDWRNSDGSARAPGQEKVVPWYAIKINGQVRAEFPPTLDITIAGREIEEAEKTNSLSIRDRITQPALRPKREQGNFSDNDNNIDLEALKGDTSPGKGITPDDSTIAAMQNTAIELPLAMFQNRLKAIQELEKNCKKKEQGAASPTSTESLKPQMPDIDLPKLRECEPKVMDVSNPLSLFPNFTHHLTKGTPVPAKN